MDLAQTTSYLNTSASIRVFTWLDDPNIGILLLLKLLVRPRELNVLRVRAVGALNIEGKRYGNLEWVDAHSSVVVADVEEQRLLV